MSGSHHPWTYGVSQGIPISSKALADYFACGVCLSGVTACLRINNGAVWSQKARLFASVPVCLHVRSVMVGCRIAAENRLVARIDK